MLFSSCYDYKCRAYTGSGEVYVIIRIVQKNDLINFFRFHLVFQSKIYPYGKNCMFILKFKIAPNLPFPFKYTICIILCITYRTLLCYIIMYMLLLFYIISRHFIECRTIFGKVYWTVLLCTLSSYSIRCLDISYSANTILGKVIKGITFIH